MVYCSCTCHCRGLEGTCPFASNQALDNPCPKAHSDEELHEWSERYQEHVENMTRVHDLELYSGLEDLLARYYLSESKDDVVSIHCRNK